MEVWLLILLSLLVSTSILLLLLTKKTNPRLPPGPVAVPLLGNLLWLRRRSVTNVDPLLRDLHKKYGPIITLRLGSRVLVFISDRHLAHKVLIEKGAAFSDRPAPLPVTRFLNGNQRNISSAAYGPLWRLLRRNLTAEILHPSRVKLYADGRKWVLDLLVTHLNAQSQSSDDGSVAVKDTFQFAMFCLLVLMCFGEKLDEKAIRGIEAAQRDLLLYGRNLNVLAFFPSVSKYVFRRRLRIAVELRQKQTDICLPLIKARREHKERQLHEEDDTEGRRFVYSYLDSLLDIRLPEEEGGGSLTEDEMVSLCSEFLTAGTDTTSTALQWIMAELVRNQAVQRKLYEEIKQIGEGEEELHRMPYLKAVIMEGLRRHPPTNFVLPHSVTEEEGVEIEGYIVPKKASVNFMVGQMAWDEKVWEEPMEFKPERFLEEMGVDITGSREIKIMPFGVGRRMCPGLGLAMLHLEYFVANLVKKFEWKVADGHEVDLTGKPEFTVVMKYPLRARLVPRSS